MRSLFVLLTFSLLALTACDKSTTGESFPENLTGRWNYTQSFYSIGGPPIYVSTEDLHQWIDFGNSGSFNSNLPQFSGFTSYEVIDSTKIKLIHPTPTSSERFFVRIDQAAHTLTISSADRICIEGCGSKFKR